MPDVLAFIAAANLAGAIFLAFVIGYDRSVRRNLEASAYDQGPQPLPSVSLVVPARNEERAIEAAVRTLLTLDYPNLQVTLVNDRSTDQTGAILDRLAAEDGRLNVVHLTELPAGWLGKNNALQIGADRSTGEWLLFTDADIFFHPAALRRAISFAVQHQVDHLAAMPEVNMRPWLLRAFFVAFAVLFSVYHRTWRVRDPKSGAHVGIGAFNLVHSDVYRAIDGHRPIRLRPDDDVKLGKLIKLRGYRQDLVNAVQYVTVEWYSSLRELLQGLEKNMFAGTDYRLYIVLISAVMLLGLHVFPFVAPFLVGGLAGRLYLATAVVLTATATVVSVGLKQAWWIGLCYPIAVLLFTYIMLRTTLLNLRDGGLTWRGTFYSLRELRQNHL